MLGMGEILFLLAIVILFFGARRLPEFVKAARESVTAFKAGAIEKDEERPIKNVNPAKDEDKG